MFPSLSVWISLNRNSERGLECTCHFIFTIQFRSTSTVGEFQPNLAGMFIWPMVTHLSLFGWFPASKLVPGVFLAQHKKCYNSTTVKAISTNLYRNVDLTSSYPSITFWVVPCLCFWFPVSFGSTLKVL